MRTLTKTGIRILSAKYRSILIKCAIINASVFMTPVMAISPSAYTISSATADNYNYYDIVNGVKTYYRITPLSTNTNHYTIAPEETTDFTIRSNTGTDSYHVTVPETASSESGGSLSGNVGSGTAQRLYFDQNNTDASIFDAGAITNLNDANNYDIYADFVSNHTATYGGAIRNGGDNNTTAKIHIINGDFVINQSGYNNSRGNGGPGGAIVNGVNSSNATIDIIKGNFIGNQAHKDSGGAIMNQHLIGTITGDFLANSANSSFGGVISNIGDDSVIDSINGNFVSNLVTTVDSNWPGVGGAIYNSGTINNINGDFILNMADKNAGAIKNARKINNINGDFILNSAMGDGGAIRNSIDEKDNVTGAVATIANITGNFIGNRAKDNGGAIYNNRSGQITEIIGDFIDNAVTTYAGGAVYNLGQITGITGKFKNNSAGSTGSNRYEIGGAIYNSEGTIGTITGVADESGEIVAFEGNTVGRNGGAVYNETSSTINNIIGSFKGNSAGSNGGAIYNAGTIGVVALNDNTVFDGNYVKTADGKGGAIYNNGTVGLYADAGHSITFVGGEDVIDTEHPENNKYDIDGIYNQATLNINGNGTNTYAGTVNLYNVSDADTPTGTTNIYGGIVNVKNDAVFNQSTLNNQGIFNFNGTTGQVTNLADAETAKGTTKINAGSFTVTGNATQEAITIAEGATLTTKDNVTTTNGIANAGTLNLLGGLPPFKGPLPIRAVINSTVSGSGTTNFGNGTDNAYIQLNGAINQAMNIKEKADVETNANNIGAAVTNAGALTLTGGQLEQSVTGGNVTIAGDVTSDASIASTIGIDEGKSLTIDADNIDGAVANAGILTLDDGTLEQAITGSGTTNINDGIVIANGNFTQSLLNNQAEFNFNGTTGLVETLSGTNGITNIYTGSFTVKHTTIQDKITVAKDAILTLGDDDGYSEINEISNDGTLNLYDANIKQIIGTGTTTIYSMATMDAGITQDNLIIDGNFNTYLVVSADGLNIKNGIINNGTLELTDGVLTSDVSGNGKIQIASDKVTNHANISNRIGNDSEFVNNGNIENSEFVNFIGSSLVNNNYIKTTFLNNGGIVDNNGKIIADEIENKSAAGLNMSSGSVIQGNIYGGTINSNGTNTVIGSIQDAEENPVNLCLNSGTLNMSGEISVSSTTADGGSLGLINNNISTANLGNLSLDNNMNISIDAHLANETMDQLNVTSVSGGGNIVVSDIKLLSDANDDYVELSLFADGTTTDVYNKVSGNLNGLAYSSTYKYDALYDSATGMIGFTRYNSGTSDDFNPYLYAPSVVANTTAAMTTQIATLAMDKMDDAVYAQGRSGGDTPSSSNAWVKVMGLNDNVEFKNFENVDSKALTVAAGYNTNKITCGDCGIVFGAYAGYIGGKQHYTANDIDQNGGYVGLSSALTLRNAFLTATVNGGLLKNKANNMYGSDRFNTLWLGTGLKAGYNYAITDSVVLQPNVYGGYTLVNTKDYTSVSGVKIATNNLNFFEVDPGLKLSVVIADGWTGSVQGKYAIVMDNGADITANDIALQNISTKNYVEYGIGIDKSLTDAFYLGAKINRRDGGRTGWNGSIECKYKF